MSAWWLSETLVTLRAQVDATWPKRDKASDGTVGDSSHAATVSDHNPDPKSDPPGCVRAFDIDANLGKTGDMTRLVNQLRENAADDGRILYIIYAGHITSGTYPNQFWTWRKYNGDDPHTSHAHVSVKASADHTPRPFRIDLFAKDDEMPLSDADVNRIAVAVWDHKINQPDENPGDGLPREPRKASVILAAILNRVRS